MNNALEMLYDEHNIIKSVIELREDISKLIITEPEKYEEIMRELINFFRNYADKFHHHKEEQLLFPLLAEKNELLQDGVVQEMLENHNDFRELVKNIERAVNIKDFEQSNKLLAEYSEMLLDHIAVEDEELFQSAKTLLDEKESEKMYFDFQDIDNELGIKLKNDFENVKAHIEVLLS